MQKKMSVERAIKVKIDQVCVCGEVTHLAILHWPKVCAHPLPAYIECQFWAGWISNLQAGVTELALGKEKQNKEKYQISYISYFQMVTHNLGMTVLNRLLGTKTRFK